MTDLDIIAQLEQRIGKKLKKLDRIGYHSVGYELNEFQQVVGLGLNYCDLETFPEEIVSLVMLKTLYLTYNLLTMLPESISNLENLQRLELNANYISRLPVSIGRLENLLILGLDSNSLYDLPSSFSRLSNLQKLGLGQNDFNHFPSEICDLNALSELWLRGNNLFEVPSEIAYLASLTNLGLDSNQLRTLPMEITELRELWLNIEDNPLKTPPYEIAREGMGAIRDYFNALGESPQSVNELKVVLVGEGASGKTSLVKRLFGEDFDQHEKQTHGIRIRDWTFPCDSQRTLKARLWDFGGQQIMHATHQFFLSKRSLYLLVLDGRREEKTEYWLQHIEALGGKSPTLVILNKIDENPGFEINRRFLKEKYPFIVDFYRISCYNKLGITELKTAIQTAAMRVEILETLWAVNWLHVKQALEQKNQDGVDYIRYGDYLDICEANGIKSETVQRTLIKFLHDLGVVIHFPEALLEETNVINPEWVTEAVYKIINSKELADKTGILSTDDLRKLLSSRRYQDNRSYIVGLMKKFELCYEVPDNQQQILVPDLLEVQQPDFEFDFNDAIRFALQYEFLPKTIMAKFIVRMHREIKQKLQWRTGVVLEDQGVKAAAVVKADEEAKKIFIDVNGQQRREYLRMLLYNFHDIHKTFAKMDVKELIRLPDDLEETVVYQDLINMEQRGVKTYPTRKRDYQITELLGTVRSENPVDETKLLLNKLAEQLSSNQDKFHKESEKLIRELAGQIMKKLPQELSEQSLKDLGLEAIAAAAEMDLKKLFDIFKEIHDRAWRIV